MKIFTQLKMHRSVAGLALGAAALMTTAMVGGEAYAQGKRDFSAVKIRTIQVAPNINMLMGAGGNIGVVSGDDGIFMIDDQFAPLSTKILAAIKKISDKPIRFLLNTHWHGDHTGGNANVVKATGATVVAHEHVRQMLSSEQVMKAFNRTIPAAPQIAWPVVTFKNGTSFHMNGESIDIRHLPAAHTGGDAMVHFKNANVIHMGDTFFNGFFPFIDVGHGGSIDGLIKAAATGLSLANDQTKIIPGHGPLGDKAALQRYHDVLVQVRNGVAGAMSGGKTVQQVMAAKPLAAIDEKWKKGFMKPSRFIPIIYSSLKK